jgi:RNA polymerase sigma-70 factor (ECF subfamily)
MEEPDLIRKIRTGDEMAFEELFRLFYEALCRYAQNMVNEPELAEEIVQEMFVQLWEKRQSLDFHTGIRPYLYKAVHNRCLNQIQHQKVRILHQQEVLNTNSETEQPASRAEFSELKERFNQALLKLPEECRKVFKLSRENEFSYREIADFLGISIKTVENQMGKALRIMRDELKDFLPLISIVVGTSFFFFSYVGVIIMLTV